MITPYTPVSAGQKNLQLLQTQLVLLRKLLNTSGRRKAPHATSCQESTCGPHLPSSFLCPRKPAPTAQRGTAAFEPAPIYSRLKWLRQARSTILARNRMATPALRAPRPPPQKAAREGGREGPHAQQLRAVPGCAAGRAGTDRQG